MSLFLPKHYVESQQSRHGHPISPMIGVFIGYHDLMGQKVELAELCSLLASLRRSDVIRLTAWTYARATSREGISSDVQRALVGCMLDDELKAKARESSPKHETTRIVFFHRQQLWLLLQLACIVCREDATDTVESDLMQKFGRCCLMASDFVEFASLPDDATDEEKERWALASLGPSLEIHADMNWIHHLARAYHFWIDLPADRRIAARVKSITGLSFDDVFRAHYHVALPEFIAIATGLFSHFRKQEDSEPRLLDAPSYYSLWNNPDAAKRTIQLLAQTPDEFARAAIGEPRQSWSLDITPLRRRPVFSLLDENRLACPDLSLLCRALTDGIYWLLHDACASRSADFKSAFGHVFESYVNRLFSRFTYQGSELATTFYEHPKFEGSNDEVCDALIYYQKVALLFEYKSALLSRYQRHAGNQQALYRGVDSMLANTGKTKKKGVGQLAKSLHDIVGGRPVAASGRRIDLTNHRLIPALVVYDAMLDVHAVRRYLDSKLRKQLRRLGTDVQNIGPLVISHTSEIELLEEIAPHDSIENVITNYVSTLSDKPSVDALGSLGSHLYNHFANKKQRTTAFVQESANKLLSVAISHMIHAEGDASAG